MSVLLAAFAAGCTSSSTSTSIVAPTENKCSVTATTSPSSFSSAGGAGQLTVSAERDCTWNADTTVGWVSITGPTNGQGEATVSYRVAANATPASRQATLDVAAVHVNIAQEGAPCRFTLDHPSAAVGADGGGASFAVAAMAGCSWTAASDAAWAAISAGRSGNGSGTVALTVQTNSSTARVAHVVVADQTFTVTQAAQPATMPTPTPTPTPAPTPTPTPTPTPAPPPSPPPPPPPTPPPPEPPAGPHSTGENVRLDGTVVGRIGSCPNIGFWVRGQFVIASAGTDYKKKDSCEDVRNLAGIVVSGQKWTDGTVRAESIDLKKARDD